jgi:hypothetical protein
MPIFYLHVCNGNGFNEDREGIEFPDAAAARDEAIRGLRSIAADDMLRGEMDLSSFVEIEDEQHQPVETVHFADAVNVRERGN